MSRLWSLYIYLKLEVFGWFLQTLRSIKEIFDSFKSMSTCYHEPETTPNSLTPQAELDLAMAALPGLYVFGNYTFVEREVKLAITV